MGKYGQMQHWPRHSKGEGAGEESQGVWDGHVHSIFKMDNQQGPIVQHMKLC